MPVGSDVVPVELIVESVLSDRAQANRELADHNALAGHPEIDTCSVSLAEPDKNLD